jgi:hypothetical protein
MMWKTLRVLCAAAAAQIGEGKCKGCSEGYIKLNRRRTVEESITSTSTLLSHFLENAIIRI